MNIIAIVFLMVSGFVSGLASTSCWGSDFQSPRTAALGGASHAGPLLNDAIYLNPSFASFLPTYSMSANYLWFNGSATEPDGSSFYHGHNLNASIQDGRSEVFQAGLGYTITENARMLHLGASKSFIKRMGFGMGGKFIFPKGDASGVTIRDATVSMSGIATEWLHVVAVLDNVFQTDSGKARGLYRELVIGTKFNIMGIMLIYFDPHWTPSLSDSKYGHETGLELTMFKDFFLRFGAFRNASVAFEGLRGRGYGTGVGWIAPKVSFDYGLSRVLEPQAATAHTLGMTLFF